MDKLVLLPAIDVQNGQAVRLLQGEYNKSTQYGTPADVAQQFVEIFGKYKATAEHSVEYWVHLVDIDAAFGTGNNAEIIKDVVQLLVDNAINVEVSGGIRDDASLERALEFGASRVNISTIALENPVWTAKIVQQYGDAVAIGLDVRNETLTARGWTKVGGNLWEVLKKMLADGASRFVVTDVTKDGTLQGVNVDLLRKIASFVTEDVKITASGGVASLADLKTIRQLQVETNSVVDSVIFGKAMYSGKFSLAQALEIND